MLILPRNGLGNSEADWPQIGGVERRERETAEYLLLLKQVSFCSVSSNKQTSKQTWMGSLRNNSFHDLR